MRKTKAADAGAFRLIGKLLREHPNRQTLQDTGVATFKLLVARLPALKKRALEDGAASEWVEEKGKSGGILNSFRGFGTGRNRTKNKDKTTTSGG